ncbi:MAG TPA: 16S rRNA (cytidine(1402)-2'-O)-methyltransferase [candidate division WWE3 bacterium]|uniref:Ribosomal RNA small subunit methyltransferase I n=1 Tax=candidate division WWE3 bacterium TaxID=2053526 RepID=A0A7C1HMR1_UNCKA|nr:16S rRNA (cytidine(1402)-2'-O)-methyltransferase [candidate division WWE3 bacterium]
MACLFVISTPIGNMEDISMRAVNTLKSVNLILSEDTRETQKILSQHQIETPQISYRDQNHDKVISHIKTLLEQDKDIVLVSDNGTPTISDPGFKLIRDIKLAGIPVSPIPGPSAVTAALSVSGLPTDNFTFLGFLPKKSSQIAKILLEFGNLPTTLVIYESPFRIRKLLEEIHKNLGNRVVCVAKDLTKKFESVETAPLEQFLTSENAPKEKGEYVVLVAKKDFKYE